MAQLAILRLEDLTVQFSQMTAPAVAEVTLSVIKTRRFWGREYRYCLQTSSGKKLHARIIAQTALPIGTRVQLSVVEKALRFFPSC